MNPDTQNAIYFLFGGLSTGIPMSILFWKSMQACSRWHKLCNELLHEAERAHFNFNSMYCQYLQLLALRRSEMDEPEDRADWWRKGE